MTSLWSDSMTFTFYRLGININGFDSFVNDSAMMCNDFQRLFNDFELFFTHILYTGLINIDIVALIVKLLNI